jgi:hypothetical protein
MGMYIAILLPALAIILFTLFVSSLFYSLYSAEKSGAPFYMTGDDIVRRALKEADLRPDESFYDLGAGNGKVLAVAEKEFGAKATGFEISIVPYMIGRLNLLIKRSRAKLIKQNFWNADISDADVVFCFLIPRTMQKMEDKLKAELKPGTRIVTYAFPLPTLAPIKTITIHGNWKMFFYRIG